MNQQNKSFPYKDRWIKLVGSLLGAHYIDSLNRSESLFERLLSSVYYINLISGFLIAITLWEIVSRVSYYLDSKYSWFETTALRIVLQTLLGVLLPSLLCFFLEYAYLRFYWQQSIFEYDWVNNEFRVVLLVLVFVNFFYFTYWLYHQLQLVRLSSSVDNRTHTPSLEENPLLNNLQVPEQLKGLIEVSKGNKTLLISSNELAFAYLRDGYCYLKMFNAETFVTNIRLMNFIYY